eukprot:355110-Chlamydomonas_euryale.AAC.6
MHQALPMRQQSTQRGKVLCRCRRADSPARCCVAAGRQPPRPQLHCAPDSARQGSTAAAPRAARAAGRPAATPPRNSPPPASSRARQTCA